MHRNLGFVVSHPKTGWLLCLMRVLFWRLPMNTALFLAAVLSATTAASPTTPTWNGSYVQAQDEAAGKKPLAVVFGSGQEGWAKLVRSEESKKLLAEQYVCVYVDVATEGGKKLAQSFAINGETGVVLSDRT